MSLLLQEGSEELSFDNSPLTVLQYRELADYLRNNHSLKRLTIKYNEHKEEDDEYFFSSLATSFALSHLNLSLNRFKQRGIMSLCNVLKSNGTLESLDLSFSFRTLKGESMKSICDMLKVNNTLTDLDISCCNIDSQGVKTILSSLERNISLTKLSLSYNDKIGSLSETLSDLFRLNSSLAVLKLNYCYLYSLGNSPERDFRHFFTFLEGSNSLTSLDLSNGIITLECIENLCDTLKTNVSLTKLVLSYNDIGVEGCYHISELLSCNGTLTNLSLKYNKIGCEGLEILSKGLGKNSGLRRLDLDMNFISNKGIESVCKSLKDNYSLEILDLSFNCINILCKDSLLDMFEHNPTVILCLGRNKGIEQYSFKNTLGEHEDRVSFKEEKEKLEKTSRNKKSAL